MYAVTFDIDTNCLNDNYSANSSNNIYYDIKKFMLENGFKWIQGSVYFGDNDLKPAILNSL